MFTRSFRVLCLLSTILVTLSKSEAAPDLKFKKTIINGINTYLINTGRGNAMALTVNVQVGSWHDDPVKYAGRAHLWEHTIFLGSKKYPGHHQFDELTAKVGGQHNAYTANDRTFYYFNQHPSSLPLSVSLLGGMISEPVWNNDAFLKEKENVKNEALDYQNRDGHAVWDLPFLHLSPKGYPLAMYHVGTQDQLTAMTLEDLKKLFQSYYRPEHMQIIVAGNFDASVQGEDRLDETQLIHLLHENFQPTATAFQPSEFKKDLPSLYPEDPSAPRMIEVGTSSDQKILHLYFQATEFAHQNPFLAEILTDALNLNTRGSLTRLLKDRGLVTSGGIGMQRINNQTLVYIQFDLTESGAKQRALVMDLIFETLGNIEREGLSSETFSYLVRRNISSYEEMIQTPYQAAEHFAKFLDLPFNESMAFDFEAQYGTLKTSDIPKIATALFSPSRMIGVYLGNDVEGKEQCPVFGRKFNRIEGAQSLQRWDEAFQGRRKNLKAREAEIELRSIPLTFSEKSRGQGEKPAAEIKSEVAETQIALQEDHSSTHSAVTATLLLRPAESEEAVARNLFILAFQDHFNSEISYLSGLNLMRGLKINPYQLDILVKGNSEAGGQSLRWLLDRLLEFTPTAQELERARAKSISSLISGLDGFTAHTATGAASSILSNVGQIAQERLKISRSIKIKEILKYSKNIFLRADIILAATGDATPGDLNELAQYLRTRIPKVLTATERRQQKEWSFRIRQHALVWAPLGDSKAEDAFGHVRVYEGPQFQSKDALLFGAFSSALGNAIYQLNRSERNLGYVHHAYPIPGDSNWRLMLAGQTDGLKNFARIAEGWEELLDQVKDGSFSAERLQDTIDGRRLTLLLKPSTQAEAVDKMMASFRMGQIDRREKELEALRTATPEALLEVGRKYIKSKQYLEVIASKTTPCREALKSIANARRKLKKR